MISSCTHCGAQYELPDKMLGKQARCKACKKSFVLVPSEEEVELPEPTGSTTRMNPVRNDQIDDALSGLASASFGSMSDMAPSRGSRSSSRHHEDEGEHLGRRRMAKGAQAAMGLGITSCVITAAGVVLMIIAMVNSSNQSLMVTLGIITLGLMAIGAVCGMIAVVNGSAANSKIRRARHPLSGRSQASTGSLTGAISLGVVFVCAIVIGVWLSKRGGITFEKEVLEGDSSRIVQPLERYC